MDGLLVSAVYIVILASTRFAVQLMLNVCPSFSDKYNVLFNAVKSNRIIYNHDSTREVESAEDKFESAVIINKEHGYHLGLM